LKPVELATNKIAKKKQTRQKENITSGAKFCNYNYTEIIKSN